MLAVMMFAVLACGPTQTIESVVLPTPCAKCDLLTVSDNWLKWFVVRNDELVLDHNTNTSQRGILEELGNWALLKRSLPNAFTASFKDEYWQAMKWRLEQTRAKPWRFEYLDYAGRLRELFPERVGELGLDEVEYQKGLCELRHKLLEDSDFVSQSLDYLMQAFPEHASQLQQEFHDVLEADRKHGQENICEMWWKAVNRTTCRCEWQADDETAFINAYSLDIGFSDSSMDSVVSGVGWYPGRLKMYRGKLIEEIQSMLKGDREAWSGGKSHFAWYYIQAMRGALALREADAVLEESEKKK